MNVDTQSKIANAQNILRNKAATSSKTPEELGKEDFMNLFLTQMSHQDPSDPMDSGTMMAQLAQLGSMEQLQNLNNQMKDLNLTQKDISRFQSLNFLDKDVLLEAKGVELKQGSTNPFYYSLDREMDNLKVTIEDIEGGPVYSQELGLTAAGKHQFLWDGKNDEGTIMPDGNYKIRVMATDSQGNSTPLQVHNLGRVSQVEYRDGKPWIRTQKYNMPLAKVKSVDNSSSRTFGNAIPLPLMKDLPPKELMVDKSIKKEEKE
jgi:flagellar basal-body rod modification protein FlgD